MSNPEPKVSKEVLRALELFGERLEGLMDDAAAELYEVLGREYGPTMPADGSMPPELVEALITGVVTGLRAGLSGPFRLVN